MDTSIPPMTAWKDDPSTERSAKQTFNLLALPKELRLLVYEQIPPRVEHCNITHKDTTRNESFTVVFHRPPTPILGTCRLIREEAAPFIQPITSHTRIIMPASERSMKVFPRFLYWMGSNRERDKDKFRHYYACLYNIAGCAYYERSHRILEHLYDEVTHQAAASQFLEVVIVPGAADGGSMSNFEAVLEKLSELVMKVRNGRKNNCELHLKLSGDFVGAVSKRVTSANGIEHDSDIVAELTASIPTPPHDRPFSCELLTIQEWERAWVAS